MKHNENSRVKIPALVHLTRFVSKEKADELNCYALEEELSSLISTKKSLIKLWLFARRVKFFKNTMMQ